MSDTPAANVLPAIESQFAFLVDEFGFSLAQTIDVPSSAWYRNGDRTVVVSFDFIRDAAVEVAFEIASTEERHTLYDVLAFSPVDAHRLEGVRERPRIVADLARLAALVKRECAEFLTGDVEAFRLRYREALLVKSTRAAALHEFYEGDVNRARALFAAMRAYWNDADREHADRLRAGDDAVRMLRRRG
jgi:hypothetical protein